MKLNNGIYNYNQLFYTSGPVKVSDYLSNIYNIVHQELYEDALSKFYVDYPEFKDNKNIKIIEIKDKEYWQPSRIQIIDYTKKPLKKYDFSLKNYWNNIYVKKDEEGSIPDNLGGNLNEVDFINYMTGKVTMLDKYNNDKYKVDFKYLGKNIVLSNDYDVYPETFEYKKIKGNS